MQKKTTFNCEYRQRSGPCVNSALVSPKYCPISTNSAVTCHGLPRNVTEVTAIPNSFEQMKKEPKNGLKPGKNSKKFNTKIIIFATYFRKFCPTSWKKRWCHGHLWPLLKPKFRQACHVSRGLPNWSNGSLNSNSTRQNYVREVVFQFLFPHYKKRTPICNSIY